MGKEGFSYIRPTEEQALRNLQHLPRSFRSIEPTEGSEIFDPGSLRAIRGERRRALRAIERQRLSLRRIHGQDVNRLPEFVGLTRKLRELQKDQFADRRFLTSPTGQR